jgi:hypothetical protein
MSSALLPEALTVHTTARGPLPEALHYRPLLPEALTAHTLNILHVYVLVSCSLSSLVSLASLASLLCIGTLPPISSSQ